MTVAQALREALQLMNNEGAHWLKGAYARYGDSDDERAYCSAGAINFVTAGHPEAIGTESTKEPMIALAAVLEDVPPPTEPTDDWTEFDYALNRVVTWNDTPERTWEDIVRKFTEAAEKADSPG